MKRFNWFALFLAVFMLQCQTPVQEGFLELGTGPHLFIDDHFIAEQSFLSRTVNNPEKYPEPIITGGEDGDENFQPYMTVLRDKETKRFRIWYGTPIDAGHSHIAYMESEDGIHWLRPHRVLEDPLLIEFGVSVVDRGADYADPTQRYLFAAHMHDGMMIATSALGFDWKPIKQGPVLKHNHDITSFHWDPIRKHYLAIISGKIKSDKWEGKRRIPYQSVSNDLLHWKKQWPVIMPKTGAPVEQGETQFYGMSGVITRGDLLIGLVKILRDDINATPGKSGKELGDRKRKAAGLGYTVLAWSRDGKTWQRDHQVFIPRNPVPGSWDHAMAWGDEQIVVEDETFIYYGGYKRGHKVARFDERQIGLARMPRDRYVSREAGLNEGRLITKPLILNAKSISVNANVVGKMRIRLLDRDGQAIEGFDWVNISGDAVDHPVKWKQDLKSLGKKTAQIEFRFQDAQLYSFDLHE